MWDYLRCKVVKMKGMPSHFLPPLLPSFYPQTETANYYSLYCSVLDYYYSSYIERLQDNRYNRGYLDWYYNTFGTPYPMSFVVNNKTGFTLSPGQSLQWLVFVHTGNAVHMHITCYLIVNGGRVQLFRDGPTSLTLDMGNGNVSISGLIVPHNHTISMVTSDVRSL
jgi:hypothetical protein